MKLKPGDTVLICSDMDSPANMREYTVTKVGKETIQCGSSENTFYTAFTWPIKYKEELIEILKRRQELKKAFDDSFTLVLELRNKISRESL